MRRHSLAGETRLYSAAQVGELDRIAIEQFGIPGYTLMRRAARAAFDALRRQWPQAFAVAVFCGGGNNGGDGYLLAALAAEAGLAVDCFWLSDPGKLQGDAAAAHDHCRESGVEPRPWQASDAVAMAGSGLVIVDAMLGTGLARPVTEAYADAISAINDAGQPVLAIDLPSGLNADTGTEMGCAVHATLTVTFIGLKRGAFTAAGPACCGNIVFAGIDVPSQVHDLVPTELQLLDEQLVRQLLPPRRRDAHKGQHGHVLMIGGDTGMSGAIRMAAEAALRAGAGLVTVATKAEHCVAITQHRPELMCRAVDGAADLQSLLERASVVAVGPGLGTGDWGRGLLKVALQSGLPLILDADALNLLAADDVTLPAGSIITPHPGEAARLLRLGTREVQADRFRALRALVEKTGAVTVLKGAGTLIGDARDTRLCAAGNPGMAVAGMGDLLCGVVAAMRAQGLAAADAAALGVLCHAWSGDAEALANGERGMLPGDLFSHIRRYVNPSSVQA